MVDSCTVGVKAALRSQTQAHNEQPISLQCGNLAVAMWKTSVLSTGRWGAEGGREPGGWRPGGWWRPGGGGGRPYSINQPEPDSGSRSSATAA